MNETYQVRVSCSNCGHTEAIDIPKGVKISRVNCENCGCKTLYRNDKGKSWHHHPEQNLDKYITEKDVNRIAEKLHTRLITEEKDLHIDKNFEKNL